MSVTDIPPEPPQQSGLPARAASVGGRLMAALRELLEEAGCGDLGTQATAHHLGITPVLSSRTRRAALAETRIEALLRAPGPTPLRRVVEAAGRRGAREAATAEAERAIAAFEALIEEEAGSRRTLDSMLVDLGSDRASFEAQRRQEIFKAYTEFEGLSIDALSLTLLVGPSDDGEHVDAVFLFGAFVGSLGRQRGSRLSCSTRALLLLRLRLPGAEASWESPGPEDRRSCRR